VNEQTSLTGGGTVDIDVEDKTTLKGAVIASTTGDLTLETGSLEYSNIKDKDKSYSVGGGMDVGTKSDKSYGNYEFSDKKQTNFATIGEGNIIITDEETDLTKLNRDLTVAQYNTKEGGHKGGFTIDDATLELMSNPEKMVTDTLDSLKQGYEDAKGTTGKIVDEADNLKNQVSKLLFGESIGGVVDGGIKNSDFTYNPPEAGSKEVNEKKEYLGKLINDLMIDKGYSQFDEEGNVISFNESWEKVSDQDKLLISLLVADELSNNNQYSKKDFNSLDMKAVANKVFDMADNGLINLGTSENNYNTSPGLIESIKNCITGETFKPTLDISESAMENPLTMAYSLIHEGTHAVDYESDWAQFFMENNKTTINSISEINARINETVAFSQTLGNFVDIANSDKNNTMEVMLISGQYDVGKMADFYYKEYGAYKENSVNGIIQNLQDHIDKNLPGFSQYSSLDFKQYEDYRFVLNGGKTDEWTKIEGPYMLKNNLNSEPLTWPNKSLTNPNFGKDNYNYYKKSYNNQIEQKKYEDENPQFTKPGLGVDKNLTITK